MPIAYPNIAEKLFGRPHAIEPGALRAIMDGPLAKRVLRGEKLSSNKSGKRDIRKDRLAALANAEMVRSEDGIVDYAITPEGVAIIPIAGVLSRRFDWLSAACGWTTYEGLGATFDRAINDQRAKAILFDVDSPGGEADGMLDIADQILSARDKTKPIWAVANTLAASAAYAVAGSADTLLLPRLAIVGSIGCLTIHVDQSQLDGAEGLHYTAIYSGARKIDGWEHAPLSDQARLSTQECVDYVRGQFANLVGRQGRMTTAEALATEADIYPDQRAVDARLADGVMTFNEALARLTAKVSQSSPGAFNMTKKSAESEPAIIVAATEAGQIEAETVVAAVVAETVGADVKAEMAPPEPGQKCQLCGHVMDDPADAKPQAVAPSYGQAEIEETMEICALAKASIGATQAFVQAKTPPVKVRAALLAAKAAQADANDISTVDPSTIDSAKGEARMNAWRDTQAKVKREMGIAHSA